MSEAVSKTNIPSERSGVAGKASPAAAAFRRAMDALYWTGAVASCIALVLISAIIPWAVYTRYIMNSATAPISNSLTNAAPTRQRGDSKLVPTVMFMWMRWR